MVGIRVNNWTASDRKREYAALHKELFPHAVKAVEDSFINAKMMNPTKQEADRRCKIAVDLMNTMRFEYRWSRRRIKDKLSQYLSLKLLGLEVDLDIASKRQSW